MRRKTPYARAKGAARSEFAFNAEAAMTTAAPIWTSVRNRSLMSSVPNPSAYRTNPTHAHQTGAYSVR
jgi:hypothetical protein